MQHFKHSIIPLALCAIGSTALAQSGPSNITSGNDAVQMSISGRVDLGMFNKHVASATSNTSNANNESVDGDSTGRIKFSGTSTINEDINSFFDLEMRATMDNGTQDGVLFKDKAWVGLASKKYGALRLGRMSGPLTDVVVAGRYEAFGGDSYASNGTRQAGATDKWNNAVNLQSPSMGGVVVGLSHKKGEDNAENFRNGTGAYISYTGDLLGLAFGIQEEGESLTSDKQTTGFGANYKIGTATIMATWARTTRLNAADDGSRTVFTTGFKLPYGPGEVRVSYKNEDQNMAVSSDVDSEGWGVGYFWPLNKSTSINVSVRNDILKNYNANGSDKNTVQGTGYGVGLRMVF
nr:porin [uncultured Rhodoferax sp.]